MPASIPLSLSGRERLGASYQTFSSSQGGSRSGRSPRRPLLALAPRALLGNLLRPAHDLDKIPGPPSLPLLGNLLDIGHPRAHQTIVGWAAQWPIYKFELLTTKHIVLTDPTEIAPLVSRGPEELPRPSLFYTPFNLLGGKAGLPSLVTTKNPALSVEVRRVCMPAFSPDNIRKAFPVIRQVVGQVCDHLAEESALEPEEGVDMNEAALRVSLDVVGQTMFARDFEAASFGESPVLETLPALLEEISWRALNPIRLVQHTLWPWGREAQEFSDRLDQTHRLWAELAADIRAIDVAAAEAAGDSSLRVCMAKIRNPDTGELLTEEELAPHIATFLLAAFETTAHSVAWTLYELARNPDVQAKLASELEGAGLTWREGRPGRELQYGDLAALPYLDQVWREGLRLHPAGSVVPIRVADREVTLKSGARIPRGTYFWMSIVSLHLSPFNWVDPDRYWPERWTQQAQQAGAAGGAAGAAAGAGSNTSGIENGSGTAGSSAAGQPAAAVSGGSGGGCPFAGLFGSGQPTPTGNSASQRGSFMPFSSGPHDCLGQGLANAEGKAMLAMLCSRFEFELGPSMRDPEVVRAAEVIRLTLQPGKGVWLLLKPRGGAGSTSEGASAGAGAVAGAESREPATVGANA